eukprot:362561-Chlamydomonas_euryale.AAC.5
MLTCARVEDTVGPHQAQARAHMSCSGLRVSRRDPGVWARNACSGCVQLQVQAQGVCNPGFGLRVCALERVG